MRGVGAPASGGGENGYQIIKMSCVGTFLPSNNRKQAIGKTLKLLPFHQNPNYSCHGGKCFLVQAPASDIHSPPLFALHLHTRTHSD